MSLQAIRCRPRAPPMFCGMPPSHAGSLARDCERSDPVVGDFSISGTVLVAFARLFHRHSLQTREQKCASMSAARSLSSDAVQPAFSKAGLPSTVREGGNQEKIQCSGCLLLPALH